ncbi:excalibur calcium-binding domain-containing protein [Sphingomonas aerophila]|uniref:excalibur calcium-binding domain-containing protein n=1 Tax=Sphingomonas aerophila TaxID=1344948 RepID=UPI0016102048|nr:excalibur calcium-binding domain-containing protein [Sphingomonas aerophila]
MGSLTATPQGRGAVSATAKSVGVAGGFTRARAPQPGDHWSGCNDARAVGTAPIYEGEPGYRPEMDGDSDGIACEPYRG